LILLAQFDLPPIDNAADPDAIAFEIDEEEEADGGVE